MDNTEKHTQMFLYLVGSFEISAMMAMGKIKNPMTDKIERSLPQAQFSIDLLDMLVARTKGNLSEYEQKFLENTLGQLKLNYIDESNKPKETKSTPEETKPEEPGTEDADNEDNQSA